jgi:hypothetical protein
MNTLRQTCAAAILSLALSVSAFAGQIDSPGYVPPPPPPTGTSSNSITTTIILTVISLIR